MSLVNEFEIINGQRSIEGNVDNVVVSTVPADGLAPRGVKPSAATVMTKFGFCIYKSCSIAGWWVQDKQV